ncbi:hypothetical protein Q4591_18715 [Shewanella sp. 3_MG-2023]|uniref:hypothetical protein n=1 Tax=Shewanella sp. 3_MG-2023 TaxID=3062635 RepID=UPI0026E25464|nr:hypothetical protein [Shewanella sp. 3_MG-2023]MDO6777376.1 hypothetical protein [Shewanella sp. 3_MG-2023]
MKVHLITNCSNGKRKHLQNKVSFGDVLNTEHSDIKDWVDAISSNKSRDLAINTYAGDHWKVAKDINNYGVPLWVLSAGFGFISGQDNICSYDATFSNNGENAVRIFSNTNDINKDNITWWEQLHLNRCDSYQHDISSMVRHHKNDNFCISASPQYLKVILPELIKLQESGYITEKNTIIITSKVELPQSLQSLRLIATEDFCELLQGSRVSLNIRLARYLLKDLNSTDDFICQVHERYDRLQKRSKPAKKFDRVKVDDVQVADYIVKKLKSDSSKSSATVLLNAFRSDGFACEQKRFGKIFKLTKRTLSEKS